MLEKITETCDGEILNLENNVSVLIFFEIGYYLSKSNKKYDENVSKLLLNKSRRKESTSYLAKGMNFKRQFEQVP